jgi:hypothetical protein
MDWLRVGLVEAGRIFANRGMNASVYWRVGLMQSSNMAEKSKATMNDEPRTKKLRHFHY